MHPDWKKTLLALAVIPLALVIGTCIAQGEWFWPCLALGIAIAITAGRFAQSGFSIAILGFLIFGYITGNRGFAQLSASGSLPLFPAELGLAITLPILVWQSARAREVPWRRDELNFLLIAWIMLGCIRIAWDLRPHGVAAVRDFAMVYYAIFFFVAQHGAKNNPGGWFRGTLLAATAFMLPLYLLSEAFPDFFLNTLTVRGSPLIYFKGDLAGTFLSIGTLTWFLHYEAQPARRPWALALSLTMAACMMATNNRASMLALAVPTLALALAGRTRLLKTLAVAGIAGALCLALWTHLSGKPWRDSPLAGIYERVVSITDFGGQRNYSTSSAEPKGDNNRYRAVWWETVIKETTQANPWLGLGFGHDLADNFIKTYYPDTSEPFLARSPHNFLVTIYARMGLAGFAVFLIAVAFAAKRAWQTFRHGEPAGALLAWCVSIALFTSAVFGVVLEGPMGAVVFWIALGVASSRPNSEKIESPPAEHAHKPSAETSVASP